MLPSINRLSKKNDIDRVFRRGQGIKLGGVFLKAVLNNLPESRFAFVVSNKVSKKAVVRNRLRRIFRETIRQEKDKIKKGLDIIIMALPGLQDKEAGIVRSALTSILKEGKINI